MLRIPQGSTDPEESETSRRPSIDIEASGGAVSVERSLRARAQRTADLFTRLQSLATAFAGATTTDDVADAVVGVGLGALEARSGALAVLDDEAQRLVIVRSAGYSDKLMGDWRSFAVADPLPLSDAVRNRDLVLLESRSERDRRYPIFAKTPTSNHAFASVPLIVEDRVLGGVAFSFDRERSFEAEERTFLMSLGQLTGQALERARLYESEHDARARAEAGAERLRFLAEAGDVLSSSLDYQETLQSVARLCVPWLADWCLINLVEPDGSVKTLAVEHADPAKVAWALELRDTYAPNDGDNAALRVIHSGEAELYPEVTDEAIQVGAQNEAHLKILRELGMTSVMVIPMRARGNVIGSITLVTTSESGRHYGQDDLDLGHELAHRAGMAVENARLFRNVEEGQGRAAFLAEVGAALTSSMDDRALLSSLADVTVEWFSDWCVIDLVQRDGSIERAVIASRDRKAAVLAERVDTLRRYPADESASRGVRRVIATGQWELLEGIEDSWLEREADGRTDYLQLLRSLSLRSTLCVPLHAGEKVLGAITFVTTKDGRAFGSADLTTAQEVASRAATAVEHARLFREHMHISRTLQASLLPPHLPEIPGVDVAARYHAAGEGYEVGGDFYDLFETARNDWAIVLGDVCGKGADAAATTALARHTLRAAAMQSRKPHNVLSTLNEAMLRADQLFCTAVYARLRAVPDGARITIACGGHPLPLLIRADGTMSTIGSPGTLLGCFPEPTLRQATGSLRGGDAVVLYTDGVTEARNGAAVFGDSGLRAAVVRSVGKSAEEMAREIEQAALDFQGGDARDDIAVVVLKVV
ncbi:MAG: GAF domain-containing SpoIIE family protein phosphatase [Actinomycetota bacterium]